MANERTLPITMDYPERNEVEIKHKLSHLNNDLAYYTDKAGANDHAAIVAKIDALEAKLLPLLQDEKVMNSRSPKEQERARTEIGRIQSKRGDRPAKAPKSPKPED